MDVGRKIIKLISLVSAAVIALPLYAYGQQLQPGQVWGNGGSTVASPRGSTPTEIMGRKGVYYADDYGTHHDFVPGGGTDDTAALQAALNAASAAGGGRVVIGPYMYLQNSANLRVPPYVTLECESWTPLRKADFNYSNIPCTIYHDASHTINVQGGIRRVNVLKDTIIPSPSLRVFLDNRATWGGTGITLTSNDTLLEDVNVGGFNLCINASSYPRPSMHRVFGDCNSGLLINQVHDVSKIETIEFWPFLNPAPGYVAYNISAAVDNGAGLYRVTIPANAIVTGDTIFVKNAGGAQGVNGKWTATVIDSTHVDLQGSSVTPTTTANTTLGKTYAPVTSTANLRVGQAVSGSGIPGGTTVAGVWPEASAISLSTAATATGTGVTLSFTNGAFTTGGAVDIDGFFRPGTAFTITNSEAMQLTNAFAFGYSTAFLFGDGAISSTCTACNVDGFTNSGGWGQYGVVFRATVGHLNYGNTWLGGDISIPETAVISNVDGSSLTNFVSATHNAGFSKPFEHVLGPLVLFNWGSISSKQMLHRSDDDLSLIGCNIPSADLFTNDDFYTKLHTDATTILKHNPLVGTNYAQSLTANHFETQGVNPYVVWTNSSAGTDQKDWDILTTTGGTLQLRSLDEARANANVWLQLNRASGYNLGTIQLNTTVIGGTTQTSSLLFKSTSSVSPTTDHIEFWAGGARAAFLDNGTHLRPGSTVAPTIGSGDCGAGANGAVVAGSNDQGMKVTIGATATTSCTVTFSKAWPSAPRACIQAAMNSTAAGAAAEISWNTTTVTLSGTALASANYSIVCF